jgi:flagellar hook assembly protein FlgD
MILMTSAALAGGATRDARLVHPNPFTDGCVFELNMPNDGKVRIVVYDLLGRQVADLTHEMGRDHFDSGKHDIPWSGRDRYGDPVPAGTYVCVLYAGNGEVINSVKVVKAMGIR